jgi:large subunit ribosomal protein L21
MYAVIETGGKQYRVEVGTELEVELLDVEPGQSITLERVLLVADGSEAAVGTPVVEGAAVEAEVVGRMRGDKVIAFKYQPKARRRVKKGHRQELTVLRIADIRFGGKSAAASEAKAKDAKKTERQRLEEAAARQAAEDAVLAAKLAATAEKPAESAEKPAAPKRSRTKAASAAEAPEAAPAEDAGSADATEPEASATDAEAAEAPTPKRARAKAAAADATESTSEAAPKRSRTKKDE